MFRYFRAQSDTVYDKSRLALDAAWGYPTADGRTLTCFDAAADAPHDSAGRPYLQVRSEFCGYEAAAAMLAEAMAAGVVSEVTAEQFAAVCQSAL